MGYLGRRIGLSQDKGDSTPGGADGAVGGGILDLFASGYFERQDKTFNAPAAEPSGMVATGGVISDYLDPSPGKIYRAHVFTSSGTFNVTAPGSFGDTVEYLVVAGGGAGGQRVGGGGGGGGFRTNLSGHPLATGNPNVTVTTTSYVVTVGAGGATNAIYQKGSNGVDSYFGPPSAPQGITSKGGGGGGGNSAGDAGEGPATPGGSGGGGGTSSSVGYSKGFGYNPSTPSPVVPNIPSSHPYGITQGNNGADGNPSGGGGGGGAGGTGSQGASNPDGGDGGAGSPIAIESSTAKTYAGGGGGSGYPTGTSGSGGSGGGGNGTANESDTVRTSGTYATGGGGGGGTSPAAPSKGLGGSGIVVIRYQIGTVQTAKATGGLVSFYGGKTIHTFTHSGSFATTSDWSAADVEYLVVGGGGQGGTGGGYGGGGGGAGGFKTGTTPIGAHPVSTTIQVGAGGGGASGDKGQGVDGTPSYFGTPITSTGGGGGGYDEGPYSTKGNPGGSGGGNGGGPQSQGGPNAGSPPQGNPGGTGGSNTGAGGGGAGGTGSDHDSDSTGGAGGLGRQIPATFRNPASVTSLGAPGPTGPVPGTNPGGDTSGNYWVAGGGAGGGAYNSPTSVGGGGGGGTIGTPYAGGGDGGPSSAPGSGTLAKAGIQNTGAGGGGYGGGPNPLPSGSPEYRIGGSGGSGIVIIAYPT